MKGRIRAAGFTLGLLAIAAGAAVVGARSVGTDPDQPLVQAAASATPEAGARRAERVPVGAVTRRIRRHGDRGDRDRDSGGAEADTAVAAEDAVVELDERSSPKDVSTRKDVFERVAGAIPAVNASLDAESGTDDAAAVAPGIARRVAIEEFTSRGIAPTGDAIELVGKRRPHLEEGIPVALTGRVVDTEAGLPVAGATVILASTFYVRSIRYDHHLREVAHAVTDADGGFGIERLNADPAHFGKGGRVFVTVSAEGFASALALPIGNVTPGYRNRLDDIAISRAAHVLTGRVLDRWEGAPVVGATVRATGALDPLAYPKDQRDALWRGAPTTVTDEEGRFRLTGLAAGRQMVSVHAGDDCVGERPFDLPVAKDVVVHTLGLRGRVSGIVVDEHDRPVPLTYVACGDNSTHSFADGRFKLENFRGDAVTVWFSHPGYRTLELADVADGREDLTVRLASRLPELRIAVRHHDTDAPIGRIVVRFHFADGARAPVPASPFHLSKEGVHSVRVPHGALRMTVAAAGLASRSVTLAGRTDGETVDLLLQPGP